MRIKCITMLVVVGFLLVGCGPSADDQVSMAYTAAAATVRVAETNNPPTETPLPSNTPLPTATATPAWITTAFVINGPLNLRYGPGVFFDSYGNLVDGTKVYILGAVPGGEWFQVLAPDPNANRQIVGWMNSPHLQLSSYLGTIPIVSWPEDSTLYGTVTDQDGMPVNSVRVAAVYQGENGEIRADTPTDQDGKFAIYLPDRVPGPYDLQITAVNCDSWISVWLDDGTCEVQDYYTVEWRADVYIPLQQPVHFFYEQAITHLNAKVMFADGWGYPGILVQATRIEDGTQSERVTPSNGRVSIPLGFGTWEVVAIKFDWYGVPTFSDRATYVIFEEGQTLDDYNVIIDDIDNPE